MDGWGWVDIQSVDVERTWEGEEAIFVFVKVWFSRLDTPYDAYF